MFFINYLINKDATSLLPLKKKKKQKKISQKYIYIFLHGGILGYNSILGNGNI